MEKNYALNYVYNALKYKTFYNKLYLKFLLGRVCLQHKSIDILINLQALTVNLI